MGEIKKIDNDYYIEFYARGLLYQQKAGPDLSQAERMLKQIEEEIAGGEALTIVREVELDIFFTDFLIDCRSKESVKTCSRFDSTIQHFLSYLKNNQPNFRRLSQVTPVVIEGYKTFSLKAVQDSGGTLNPRKVNLTLVLLREIFEYGIKLGFINDNPTLHIRLMDVRSKPMRIVSDEVYDQVMKEAEARSPRLSQEILKTVCLEKNIIFSHFKNSFACRLLKKGVSVMRVAQFLGLKDVGKMMRWAACIPCSRQDIYFGAHKA